MDNYLNTVNVGYNNNIEINNEIEDIENDLMTECEPIPSFIMCLKKRR